jgi:NAD(P)-dependent dehydrogenase (short-subunit alcohol dehydrogenase family)
MNIIISGTGRGIGKAIAERFLAAGDTVFGFDTRESAIEHGRYLHFVFDITRDEQPSEPIEPDILINCAGTLEEKEALAVNLAGNIRFTELFKDCASLRSVLFIASASARNGAEFPYYVASKAGIVGYMKNLALELAKRGITVNSISPGGVITESNAHIIESEALYAAVLNETLLNKWAEPGEIAELAYYMSKVNRSITGEDILIDNGEMLKSNFIW